MSPLVGIGGGSPPVLDKEKGEPASGTTKVVGVRIEREQLGIGGDAVVKAVDEAFEEGRAADAFVQRLHARSLADRYGAGMADTRSFRQSSEIHDYLVAHGTRPDAVLRDLIEETNALGGVARMQISPEQGAFMTMLTSVMGARHAIEIGTFTGY